MASTNQQAIRSHFQNHYAGIYKQKLDSMRKFYEEKYQTLRQTLQQSYIKILNDELLRTYAKDKTTQSYIEERVKELYEEIVNNQRQMLIQNLGFQINQIKSENREIKYQFEVLKTIQDKNQQTNNYSKAIQSIGLSEALRQTQKQLAHNKIDQIRLTDQLQFIRAQNETLKAKIQEYGSIASQIKDSKQKMQHRVKKEFQKKIQQMEYNHKQILQIMEKKNKKRIQDYKNKMDEMKVALQHNGKLIVNNSSIKDNLVEKEEKLLQMQHKIQRILQEKDRKINQIRNHAQREKTEYERKTEQRIKELQSYYQQALQAKVRDVQSNAHEYLQKWQIQSQKLNDYLHEYQNNYIHIHQHEQLVRARENEAIRLHKMNEDSETRLQQFTKYVKQLEQRSGISQNILKELEQSNGQLLKRNKQFEKYISELKIENRKSKEMVDQQKTTIDQYRVKTEELHRRCTELQVKSTNSQHNLYKLQSEKNSWENHIQHLKTSLNKVAQEQADMLEKTKQSQKEQRQARLKKKQLQLVIQNLQSQIQKLKKQNSKMSETHKQEFYDLTNKKNRIQEQLSNANKRYYEMNEQLIQSKSMAAKLQRSVKLQEQGHHLSLRQKEFNIQKLGTKINSQQKLIAQLENQKNDNIKNNQQLKSEVSSLKNQLREVVRKQQKIAQRIRKSFDHKINAVRKQGQSIKDYIKSSQKIYSSELVRLANGIIFRIQQQKKLNEIGVGKELREQKDNVRVQYDKLIEQIRWKHNQNVSEAQNSHAKQIKDMQDKLERGQMEIATIARENKQMQAQMEGYQTKKIAYEKRITELSGQLQTEKNSHQNKISSLVRTYTEEKTQIITTYDKKKEQLQQGIQQLAKTLKNIKKQLQQSYLDQQNQRIQYQSQIQSFKRNVQSLEKQIELLSDEKQKIERKYESKVEQLQKLQQMHKKMNQLSNQREQSYSEIEYNNNQLIGELNIIKHRVDRITEENSQLQRQLQQAIQEKDQLIRLKLKSESQLREMRGTAMKTEKNCQIKVLKQLDIQTRQLTSKVNELKKIHTYLNEKTPLRS